ncbi:MAG: hypothetical protein AAFX99_07015 [Myxococcota bacterium]
MNESTGLDMATDSALNLKPPPEQPVESAAADPHKTGSSDSGNAADARNELADLLKRQGTAKAINSIVLGRYKILDILGRGAFSVVYRASQIGVGAGGFVEPKDLEGNNTPDADLRSPAGQHAAPSQHHHPVRLR